jgi:hypothetical protein
MTVELGYAVRIALLTTLLGLVYRGHYRDCWSFVVYIVAVASLEQLQALWPERYFTYSYYLLFQAFFDVLKFAVALEVAFRGFRSFPGAQARVRAILVLILGVTTWVALRGPFDVPLKALALDWQPRTQTAAIWVMTTVALLIVWYRLPVPAIQRAILLGFVPYLTVFTTLFSILRMLDVADGLPLAVVNVANGSAYLLACLWWAYSAWRPHARAGGFAAPPLLEASA